MKTKERLPVAVTNLRKIWDQKKHEMQVTQIEAAAKLGWTQGAFSQYLNGITELGPSAVIKLANFLSVDPTDIDPNIADGLPHVKRVDVRYTISNANKILNESSGYNLLIGDHIFRIKVDKDLGTEPFLIQKGTMITVVAENALDYLPKNTDFEPYYIVQQKKKVEFEMFPASKLPPKSVIKKKYILLSVNLY